MQQPIPKMPVSLNDVAIIQLCLEEKIIELLNSPKLVKQETGQRLSKEALKQINDMLAHAKTARRKASMLYHSIEQGLTHQLKYFQPKEVKIILMSFCSLLEDLEQNLAANNNTDEYNLYIRIKEVKKHIEKTAMNGQEFIIGELSEKEFNAIVNSYLEQ